MLFVVDKAGVPSMGKQVRIKPEGQGHSDHDDHDDDN
jgi:hypothetical protein